jgi:ribosomal-protein-alanine N-acetyltransferase
MINTLDTTRLRLIAPSQASAKAYELFYTDAEASQMYGGPLSSAGAWTRLATDLGSWYLQGFGVWSVHHVASDECIGACGFWQGRGWPRELTWWLLPTYRGQGYAKEASRAAIEHAYKVFGWEVVETYMNDHNNSARALVQSLGGQKVRRQSFPDGEERDVFHIPRTAA